MHLGRFLNETRSLDRVERAEPESNWQGVTNLQNKVYECRLDLDLKIRFNTARGKGRFKMANEIETLYGT